MWALTAFLASDRSRHDPSLSTSSCSMVPKKDSATALSRQPPLRLIGGVARMCPVPPGAVLDLRVQRIQRDIHMAKPDPDEPLRHPRVGLRPVRRHRDHASAIRDDSHDLGDVVAQGYPRRTLPPRVHPTVQWTGE
jgi:hypothetical protein